MLFMCPLCNGCEPTRLFEGRDRVHKLPGVFTIYSCSRCHAVFIEPWLSDQELSIYYPEHYGGYRHSRSLGRKGYGGLRRFVLEHYYSYPSSRNKNLSWFNEKAAFLLSFVMAKGAIPHRGDGRFLDIGCGGGSFLYRLKQWGWKVYGVEPSAAGAAQARSLGLDVHHGRLEEAAFAAGFFDVVRLSHVLEHMTEPRGTFQEVRRILKPDGIVYLTVPNTRSLNFWLFGENWYGLDVPRHVISYCPKALRHLCDATGFEISAIRFRSGTFNFVRSMKYVLEEKRGVFPRWLHQIHWVHNRFIRRVLKPFFFVIDVVGFGDVLSAALRKSSP